MTLTPIPQRSSLVTQVVQILSTKLGTGEWVGAIPSERRLCQQLQVSRKTLRAALRELERTGRVHVSEDRRWHVVGSMPMPARAACTKVVVLGAKPMRVTEQLLTLAIEGLELQLHRAGFEFELLIESRLAGRDCARSLARVTRERPGATWILWGVHPASHLWFAQRGYPALVFGSSSARVRLPSVDIDYAAVMQHLVGYIAARGHRAVALLCSQSDAEGDRLTEQGFLEACQRPRREQLKCRVERHRGSVASIGQALAALFASPRTRPTAIVVPYAFHALTVLGHLAQMGLRVPDDVSIAVRDDDACLAFAVPSLCRYTVDATAFARHLARIAIRLARGETVPPTATRIIPRCIRGESVARVGVKFANG